MSLTPSQRRQRAFVIYCYLGQLLPIKKAEVYDCKLLLTVPASITVFILFFPIVLHCLCVPWGRKEIRTQQANISVEKACSAFPENTIWNIFYFEWLTSRPKLSIRDV